MSFDENFEIIEEPCVHAVVVYNPLDLSQRTVAELEWNENKPLSAYLHDLPSDIDWHVRLNHADVSRREGWDLIIPKKNDYLIIMPVPRGKNGLSILALVATVALAVVSAGVGAWVAGTAFASGLAGTLGVSAATIGAMAGALVSVAGGLLISAFMPKPDQPDFGRQDSPTYGIDGPKNTSTEGIPVPIVYGKRRVGGNIVNVYTENDTDANGLSVQDLYIQLAISEGKVKSLSDFRINDQPLSNFSEEDIEFQTALGTADQTASPWFVSTINPFQVGSDIQTTFDVYTTTSEVERVRLDIVAPNGLVNATGRSRAAASVPLVFEIRPLGATTWEPFGPGFTRYWYNSATDQKFFQERSNPPAGAVTQNSWTFVQLELDDGFGYDSEYWVNQNGEKFYNLAATPPADTINPNWSFVVAGSERDFTITAKSTSPVRQSFLSKELPLGRYEIRWRRTTDESTTLGLNDKLVLGEINEITNEAPALIHTAWVAAKLRVTSEFSSTPRITTLCEGVEIPIYDAHGSIVETRWTDNPADIALDIELNRRYGAATDLTKIDFAAFAEWRQFCIDNDLRCNLVFDFETNIDDAHRYVFICGRARPIRSGSKLSVVIDRAAEPVMVFGSSNIDRDSFELTYLGFEDRVNEVEVLFYDENDNYKQRYLRIVDDEAVARGEQQKAARVDLIGETRASGAWKYGQFVLESNKRLIRTAKWSSPVEAATCLVGDVVLVQHEMPSWSESGRVDAGSTSTQIKLDKPVTYAANKRLMLIFDALTRRVASPTNQIGSTVYFQAADLPENAGPFKRLNSTFGDFNVIDVIYGALTSVVLEDRAAAFNFVGESVSLVDTEVFEERTVTAWDENALTATVASPFSQAPSQFTKYLFGEIGIVGKPFRITKAKLSSDSRYELEAIEYRAELYGNLTDLPAPIEYAIPPVIGQVRNLTVTESVDLNLDTPASVLTVSWDAPIGGNYRGAIIQKRVNNGIWELVGEVTGAVRSVEFPVNRGEIVSVRVIAFDDAQPRSLAPTSLAPTQMLVVRGYVTNPAPPTNFTVSPGFKNALVSVQAPAEPDVSWDLFVSETNTLPAAPTTNFAGTRFTMTGLNLSTPYYFWLRARNSSNRVSAIDGPISVTSTQVQNTDFAEGIEPVGVIPTGSIPLTKSTEVIYHAPTSKLYRWNGSEYVSSVAAADLTGEITTNQIADAAISMSKFASGTRPIEVVNVLPNTNNIAGRIVYLTTDGKLYRHRGSPLTAAGFTSVISASDVTGQLTDSQLENIAAAKITGQIAGTQVADNAITTSKLAAGSVSTAKLVAGAVTTDILSANAVTAAKLAANSVTADKLTANSISADKLQANSVTAGKIDAAAVTAENIAANAITTEKIAAKSITASRLVLSSTDNIFPDFNATDATYYTGAPTSVILSSTSSASLGAQYLRIASNTAETTITSEWFQVEVSAHYLVSGSCWPSVSGSMARLEIEFGILAANGVVTPTRREIVSERTNVTGARQSINVTTSSTERRARFVATKLSNATAAELRAGGFVVARRANSSLIVDGAITADKIEAGAITADKIEAGAITADKIEAGAITAGKVAAGAISTSELAAGAVTADKISVTSLSAISANLGTITVGSANIENAAINSLKLGPAAVETVKIANNAVTEVSSVNGTSLVVDRTDGFAVVVTAIVTVTGALSYDGEGNVNGQSPVTANLLRSGVQIATLTVGGARSFNTPYPSAIPIQFRDTAGGGALRTYSVTTSGGTLNTCNITVIKAKR